MCVRQKCWCESLPKRLGARLMVNFRLLECGFRVRRASGIFPPRFGKSKPVIVWVSQDSGESYP